MIPASKHPSSPHVGFRFTGWHMIGVVGLFFGTIITVNIVMAYNAISTFPGLNAQNGYVASQNYNRLLVDAAGQVATGWTSDVAVRNGRLAITLRDRDGKPVQGLDVSALVGRPASASGDRDVILAPIAEGYRSVEPLGRGLWLAEIEARKFGKLVWRETRPLTAE